MSNPVSALASTYCSKQVWQEQCPHFMNEGAAGSCRRQRAQRLPSMRLNARLISVEEI